MVVVSPKCLVFEIRVLISLKNHETFHFFLILLCVIGVSFVLCRIVFERLLAFEKSNELFCSRTRKE